MVVAEPASPTRQRLVFALRVVLTLAILVALVAVLGDDRIPEVLRRIGPIAFLASMALNIVASIILPAAVSYVSAKDTGLSLGLPRLVLINFTIRFYTLVLPRASATGVRWIKYRSRGTGSSAAALVVLEKAIQVFIYAGLATLFVLIEADALGSAFVPIVSAAVALALASGAGLAALFTDRLDGVLRLFGFVTRLPMVGAFLQRLVDTVIAQRNRPHHHVLLIALFTAVSFGFFVASASIIANDLDVAIALTALAWIRGLVFLGTLLPITIAGAGIREAGFVGFLSIYGIARPDALGVALGLLGVQIAIGSVGGVLELVNMVKQRAVTAGAPPADAERVGDRG